MNELISVIVPVYNAEKYLRECVDSILNQTYKNFEVILVDDGSTDGSPAICDEYAKTDERVKVIRKENGGVSSARNLGLEVANGEYICFIDSDDFVSEDYLKNLYNSITENNSDMAFCKYVNYANGKADVSREIFPDAPITFDSEKKRVDFTSRFLCLNNNLTVSSWRILFAKSLLFKCKFDNRINVGEDLLFLIDVIKRVQKVSFVNSIMYFYRVNENSVMHTYRKDFLNNQLLLVVALKGLLSDFDDNRFKKVFNGYCAYLCYKIFRNEILYKQLNRRENVKKIRKSSIYEYFKIKYGVSKTNGFKSNRNFLIVWVLVKLRII